MRIIIYLTDHFEAVCTVHRAHRSRSGSWMAFFICQSKNLSVITFQSEFLGKLCSILWKKKTLLVTQNLLKNSFSFFSF